MNPESNTISRSETLERLNFASLFTPYIGQEFEKRKKLEQLRLDIGDDLFYSLSEEDKQFILDTEGIIDLGYEATEKDLKRIFEFIEGDYE